MTTDLAPASPPVSVSEYVALRAAVGWGSPDETMVRRALTSTLVWAVERDEAGRLVGLARAVGDGMYLLVVDVMVDPRCQRSGVGRRLVGELLGHPLARAARHVTLFADPGVADFYRSVPGLEVMPVTCFRATGLAG